MISTVILSVDLDFGRLPIKPVGHADFPFIALANIHRDDVSFFQEHGLAGVLFLHHAPFRNRANAISDGVCLTSLLV